MRFTNEEMEAAYTEINEKADPKRAFGGALAGVIPALVLYFIFAMMGGLLWVMLALPPMVIGFFARFVGRTYKHKHRLPVGAVGAIVHVLGCFLLGLNPMAYLLAPVAFGIAMVTAKIKLYRVHIWALDMAEQGKINTDKK